MAAKDVIHTAVFDSPIGAVRVASSKRGLAYLELPHANGRGLAGWLRRYAAHSERRDGFAPNQQAIVQIVEFLEGKRQSFDLPLDLRGTDFQLQVWNALCDIPYGETRSYADIAAAVGRPNGSRAVGGANGANPIALVVPCHRVIAASGKIGGYSGGLPLKQRLLAMERPTTTPW